MPFPAGPRPVWTRSFAAIREAADEEWPAMAHQRATLTVIPDTGHAAQWERPREFLAAVRAFRNVFPLRASRRDFPLRAAAGPAQDS